MALLLFVLLPLRSALRAPASAVPTIRYPRRAAGVPVVDVHPGLDLLAIEEPNPGARPREEAACGIGGVEPFVGVQCCQDGRVLRKREHSSVNRRFGRRIEDRTRVLSKIIKTATHVPATHFSQAVDR